MAATEAPATALDTSGAVLCPSGSSVMPWTPFHWADLDAFTQGYVEALLTAPRTSRSAPFRPPGFRDLAPEALAQIIADCVARRAQAPNVYTDDASEGHTFWQRRDRGQTALVGFPPLTVSLGDDGLIRLTLTQHDSQGEA